MGMAPATTCPSPSRAPPTCCHFSWAVLGQNKRFAHFHYLGKTLSGRGTSLFSGMETLPIYFFPLSGKNQGGNIPLPCLCGFIKTLRRVTGRFAPACKCQSHIPGTQQQKSCGFSGGDNVGGNSLKIHSSPISTPVAGQGELRGEPPQNLGQDPVCSGMPRVRCPNLERELVPLG